MFGFFSLWFAEREKKLLGLEPLKSEPFIVVFEVGNVNDAAIVKTVFAHEMLHDGIIAMGVDA